MKYVLGVDPGETTGLCLLRIEKGEPIEVLEAYNEPTPTLVDTIDKVSLLAVYEDEPGTLAAGDDYGNYGKVPVSDISAGHVVFSQTTGDLDDTADAGALVAVEDYRIYPRMAKQHIGRRLYPAEQLGAICGYLARVFPEVRVETIPAHKKARWCNKRISHWEEQGQLEGLEKVPKPHGWDALRLALVAAEEQGLAYE